MARSQSAAAGPPSRPAISDRDRKAAWGLVALGMVGHVLRSRTFHAGVTVTVVTLVGLKGIGQESGSSTLARLTAWNKREIQRLEHKAERQARKVKGAARAVG
jgi:hypothetical protein